MLIVYSTKRKSINIEDKLGSDLIKIFTSVFGNNNNKHTRRVFLTNSFVRKLWKVVANKMTKEKCFDKISNIDLLYYNAGVY